MAVPELLCPVGGMDTLQAALLGGADAVYFGAKEFNARAYAKNFDHAELKDAVLRCHEKGVRAYVTLNTLLTDRQIPKALDLVSFLYRANCDALIVADRGLARNIRSNFPDFELHASTQMSGHNTQAAICLQRDGFTRMVCARELDRLHLERLCRESPIEIEMFVHGAICACHSGQCLMSSMIGGRSGNRGECAQPCRLPYNGKYPLSFKDLSLAEHVTELLKMNLASLKIEGRMKSPSYVYTVARVWRMLLDEKRNATPKEMERLASVFSRSGFTDGYFVGSLGGKMLGIRTEQDKTRTEKSEVSFCPAKRSAPKILLNREEREYAPLPLPEKLPSLFCRTARFQCHDQIPETVEFQIRYLPLNRFEGNGANGVILPSVILDGEVKGVLRALEQAARQGAEHVLIGNLGHIEIARKFGLHLHGDFRLNLTNSYSIETFSELEDVIVSPELNLAQIRDLRGAKNVIVYGRLPLMLLEKRVEADCLIDRKGIRFPVISEGKRDLVLNSVPFYMADKAKELKERGIQSWHYMFTVETKREIEKILTDLKNKKEVNFPIKRIK